MAATMESKSANGTAAVVDVKGAPVVAVNRRTIDTVLVSLGAVVAVVLAVAGGLLSWGANFSNDYVKDELGSQNIFFPDAATLQEDNPALVKFAEQQVLNGEQAEGYAAYIDGHLQGIADGMTYAELGTPERAAKAEVTAAKEAGKSAEEIAELQAKADGISNQRNTLFKGETLRGLLLSAFAWSTIGRIAGIASITAYVAAGVMVVLVVFGLMHLARVRKV